jgi:peptidoglycan/xylan/chitin deacetylase (PgdA/CDA1 family)
LLLPLPAELREQAMSQLRSQIGVGREAIPSSRIMTGPELNLLAEGGLVEIGAHSVTHPVLTALSPPEQEAEIRQGKWDLEELLRRPVNSFSYPNGAFSAHTRTLVGDAGYSYACASFNNVVSPGSDRFALPRFWIPDWNGEKFARWLRFWLPG